MTSNVKRALRHLRLKPLQIVTTPYRHWSQRRQLAREIQEAQRKIAEAADEELAHFHEVLWSLGLIPYSISVNMYGRGDPL